MFRADQERGICSIRNCVFGVLVLDGSGERGIREGNILSGFFYVLGKIKRRENQ